MVPAREQQQPLRLVRRGVELLADRVGNALVPARVQQEQRGLGPERPDRRRRCRATRASARSPAGRSANSRSPDAQAAQQPLLGRGADRHDRGERRRRAPPRGSRRSRPCSIRAARPRGGVLAQQLAHRQHVVDRAGAEVALRAAVAARVEAERGQRRCSRQRRAKSKWLSFAEPAPWRTTTPGRGLPVGQEQRVGDPVAGPELRWGGRNVLHTCRDHGTGPADGHGVSHVFPLGSRVNEQGRLEVGGCDLVELAREFGTPAYVYAEDDIRARARSYMDAFRARTERFEVVYASKAFPCTAVLRLLAEEGLVVRRRLRRRAAHGARGRLRPAAHLPARQQQDARPSSTYALERGRRPHRRRLLRRDRPAGGQRGREGDAARDAGDQARHALLHPDGPGGLEVRLRPRRRAARDRALPRGRARAVAACTRTSARRSSTSAVVREARRDARRDGRLPAAEPRRRPRHRLHRRRRAARDRGVRRTR